MSKGIRTGVPRSHLALFVSINRTRKRTHRTTSQSYLFLLHSRMSFQTNMLSLTLLSFVAGLAVFPVALAHHAYCSWSYVPGSPADSGFTRHCLAPKIYIDSTHAQYKCLERQIVADWGYLRPYTLEFGEPRQGTAKCVTGLLTDS